MSTVLERKPGSIGEGKSDEELHILTAHPGDEDVPQVLHPAEDREEQEGGPGHSHCLTRVCAVDHHRVHVFKTVYDVVPDVVNGVPAPLSPNIARHSVRQRMFPTFEL